MKIIRANARKYPVFKICKVLKISCSTYYSYKETKSQKDPLNDLVVKLFSENQHAYGTHKLKVELDKQNHRVSRRLIARIMRYNGPVSAYTVIK